MSPASGMPRDKWLALSYDALRDKNLALFRKLNAVLFPVAYSDKFYADCMQAGKVTQMGASPPPLPLRGAPIPPCRSPSRSLAFGFRSSSALSRARAAYTLPTDMLVGGIACRYERPAGGAGATRLYIMSLGVLAPYRGRGVGQRLLVRALAEAQREGSAGDVYLHVQARPSRAERGARLFGGAQTQRSRGVAARRSTTRTPSPSTRNLASRRVPRRRCAAPRARMRRRDGRPGLGQRLLRPRQRAPDASLRGAQVTETIEGYYKRLEPSACHVLSRSLRDWTPPPGLLALEADDAEDRTMDAP